MKFKKIRKVKVFTNKLNVENIHAKKKQVKPLHSKIINLHV